MVSCQCQFYKEIILNNFSHRVAFFKNFFPGEIMHSVVCGILELAGFQKWGSFVV